MSDMNEVIVKCEIAVERIFFPKGVREVDSGGFAIFVGAVKKNIENCYTSSIKLKGNVCRLEFGCTYKVTCRLAESNAIYGNTYEILFINKKVDISSKDKQREFLNNIISDKLVEALFDTYDDVITLLEEKRIDLLCKVKGIKQATAMRIIEEYEEVKDYSSIYTELGSLGLTYNFTKKLVDYYRSPEVVIKTIREDPYDMVKINGIGFKIADNVASKVGIGFNSTHRIRGFILYTMMEQGEAGKSYLTFDELMNLVYSGLGNVSDEAIVETAQMLMDKNEVVVLDDGNIIALRKYFYLEKAIHRELMRLKNAESNIKYEDVDAKIKEVEEELGFEFTDEQSNGIKLIVDNNVIAVTGGAGCGKTTIQKGIIALHSEEYTVMACALSGKASVRITEATGLQAQTIHKTLGWEMGQFVHDAESPLECDVMILDESTMPNGHLFLSLLRALPDGCKVIFSGDVQQLTPIGNCQVFADILNSEVIPTCRLTKPHRQALRSGIIPLSKSIAEEQKQIFDSSFEGSQVLGELQDMELDIERNSVDLSDKLISHFLNHYNKCNNVMEVQAIVFMKTRGSLCTYNINKKLQPLLNPNYNFGAFIKIHIEGKNEDEKYYNIYLGDKVINTKNNYNCFNSEGEKVPVFNGNMGIVKQIDNKNCVVDFEGLGEIILDKEATKSLELAYACTNYKSQGSGFDTVIVGIDGSSYMLNNVEALYTAITRAKKYCVLIGKNSAIRGCISKREVNHKQTFLRKFLNGELNVEIKPEDKDESSN